MGRTGAAPARLPEVAQHFELAQNRYALVSQVRDWLATTAAQPTAIHHLLAQLPFATYFTTAYHDLLEQALTTAGRRFVRVVRQEDTAYSRGLTGTLRYAIWAGIEVDSERVDWATSEFLIFDLSILATAIVPPASLPDTFLNEVQQRL